MQTKQKENIAEVNGTQIFYRISGAGDAIVLLHGYAQTGHMWNPIIDELSKHHTVIVPDLRGIGSSRKKHQKKLCRQSLRS